MKFKFEIGTGKPQAPITWRWVEYTGPPRPEDSKRAELIRRMITGEDNTTDLRKNTDAVD